MALGCFAECEAGERVFAGVAKEGIPDRWVGDAFLVKLGFHGPDVVVSVSLERCVVPNGLVEIRLYGQRGVAFGGGGDLICFVFGDAAGGKLVVA